MSWVKAKDQETSLAALPFNSHCHLCGMVGQWSKDCPNQENLKCDLCGQKGHQDHFCWGKNDNTSKCLSGWNLKLDKQNVQNVAAFELLLANMDLESNHLEYNGHLVFGIPFGYILSWKCHFVVAVEMFSSPCVVLTGGSSLLSSIPELMALMLHLVLQFKHW